MVAERPYYERRSGLLEFMPEICGSVVPENARSDHLNHQYRTDVICITLNWNIQSEKKL